MKDIDIRLELHSNYLSSFYKHDPDSVIIDELGICQGSSKIDIAVVNGHLWGWEIKSEKDNLKRLPSQIQYYNKVFDYVTIVVGRNHLEEVKEMVPEFWGIMEAKNQKGNSLSIKSVRNCKLNPKIEAISLAQLLWKNETLEILERLGKDRGYKSKPRRALWQRLTEVLSLEELNSEVRSYLKNRKGWRTTDQQLVLSGG
ncbi:hypothetical protein SAMN04487907_101232 [Zunongwangia mangrovi]|uniref:Sce7726 family protein n=1 Tax=Zunongwangia mangrovi TaxID=1334022 RepID=A0A1I1DF26_9FLAO|nr:sce7726 family protein [Zunongwangia mangrovi]SFB71668.1 hypothetical protein SAMN04487907_101232 [Zunongwangia mangrovi]